LSKYPEIKEKALCLTGLLLAASATSENIQNRGRTKLTTRNQEQFPQYAKLIARLTR
jgi:hypothetical protein